MSEYCPDAWVLLKFTTPRTTIYKILGGWYGGYLGSDSWRMCSGIERVELVEDVYWVHNFSGSVYKCHKNLERMTGLMGSIYSSWQNEIVEKDSHIKMFLIDMKEYYE